MMLSWYCIVSDNDFHDNIDDDDDDDDDITVDSSVPGLTLDAVDTNCSHGA